MNNTLKLTLVGVGSFAAGAATAYFVTRKAFAAAAQEEIDSMREQLALQRKPGTPEDVAVKTLTEEKLAELRERISGGRWDPAEMSPANVTLNGEPIDPEHPQTPLSIFDEAENAQAAHENAVLNSLLAKRVPDVPYVITIDDYHGDDYDHYDKEVLKYYEDPNGDNTLIDESETLVPDIESVIGDAYNYFGIGSQDKDIVYVRRDDVSSDYEVHRIPMSYIEAVHHVDYDEIDEKAARRPLRMPREV